MVDIFIMKISILIPAHNEERSIKKTVESCLNQTRSADEIVVVDDGSTDKTSKILAKFGDKIKVITIPVATGNKSYAQEYGLKYITNDIFIATDADTILNADFLEKIEPHFADSNVWAVAGYVKSIKNNWLTACREIDYTIGQDIHKRAQSSMGFLFVIPGCAGAFRTKMFKESIKFDHDTLTEDLDFTYKMHSEHARIIFEPKAIVFTQDPFTLYSYINQIRRWYSGGWQNLIKHSPKIISRPLAAMELALMYIEGMIFSVLLFVLPFVNFRFFLYYLVSTFMFVVVLSAYVSVQRKRIDLMFYSPLYVLLIFVNSLIFLEQFMSEVVFRRKLNVWFKPERESNLT